MLADGPQSYPEDMRPVMWTIAMSGGYANWYLSTTAWVRLKRSEDFRFSPGDLTASRGCV